MSKFIRPVFIIHGHEAISTDEFAYLTQLVCPSHTPFAKATSFAVYFHDQFHDWPCAFDSNRYWTVTDIDSKLAPLLDFVSSFTDATDASVTLSQDSEYTAPKSLFLIRRTLMNDVESLKHFRAGFAGSEQELREYTKFSDGEWRARAAPETLDNVNEIKRLMEKRCQAREMESRKKRKAEASQQLTERETERELSSALQRLQIAGKKPELKLSEWEECCERGCSS